jgi:hypothetical protein
VKAGAAAGAAAAFAFGSGIFYALSSIERPVLGLARRTPPAVPDPDVRFVHQSLRRLIPLLPPTNGIVILVGNGLLIRRGVRDGWSRPVLGALTWYWAINLHIIAVGRIDKDIRMVRSTPSDGDIEQVRHGVRRLVIQHHAGLAANLGASGLALLDLVLDRGSPESSR